jgi:hypothetical protein
MTQTRPPGDMMSRVARGAPEGASITSKNAATPKGSSGTREGCLGKW